MNLSMIYSLTQMIGAKKNRKYMRFKVAFRGQAWRTIETAAAVAVDGNLVSFISETGEPVLSAVLSNTLFWEPNPQEPVRELGEGDLFGRLARQG